MKETYLSLGIGEKTYEFCEKIEQDLKERFCEIDKVAEQNQMKVLGAMQKNHVSEAYFLGGCMRQRLYFRFILFYQSSVIWRFD